jgi:hypothetical protein
MYRLNTVKRFQKKGEEQKETYDQVYRDKCCSIQNQPKYDVRISFQTKGRGQKETYDQVFCIQNQPKSDARINA